MLLLDYATQPISPASIDVINATQV
jgi:hypothetical protein